MVYYQALSCDGVLPYIVSFLVYHPAFLIFPRKVFTLFNILKLVITFRTLQLKWTCSPHPQLAFYLCQLFNIFNFYKVKLNALSAFSMNYTFKSFDRCSEMLWFMDGWKSKLPLICLYKQDVEVHPFITEFHNLN